MGGAVSRGDKPILETEIQVFSKDQGRVIAFTNRKSTQKLL